MKRILSLFMAAFLLCGIVVTGASAEEGKLFDKTLELTILSTTWSPYSTETTLIPYIEEKTNCKITVEWAPQGEFETKVNAMLATGKLPDVILGKEGAMTLNLIDQGAILPLDQYYTEEYAPNFLKALKPEDYVHLRNVADGQIYTLAQVFDFAPLYSFTVRKDWLDKLNMAVPQTWDEWLAYWRAVRDTDMNGDGDKNNEIPIAGSALSLMNSFGITMDPTNNGTRFCYMPDGSYGPIQEHPNFEAYLTAMAQLYEEKLLDQEFATRKMSDWYKVMDSGIGGSMWAAAEQSKLSTEILRQGDANATVICCPPPQGPLGDQVTPARSKITPKAVITIAAEDKAGDIVRLFDWLFSDEGAKLMNYGVEGTHHELVDSQPRLIAPYVDSFVNARGAGLIFQPFPFLWLEDSYMQILLTGKSYDALDELTRNFYDGLFLNEPYFKQIAPSLGTEAYNAYSADIMPMLSEMTANVIVGRMTLEQYRAQYEALKAQGLQAIIDDAAKAWEIVGF